MNFEVEIIKKSGEIAFMLISTVKVIIDLKPCMLFIGVDITKRKEVENEIIQINKHLDLKVKERTLQLEEINNRIIDWKINELPIVNADKSLIRIVWTNLISNAVKYTSNKEKAIIEIGCYENENEIVYFIKDNGAGFDMKYYEKLFGIFQRLHSAKDYEGTGIGLANVKKIIEKYSGKIWAESIQNEGSCFYFSLPKQELKTI